MYANALPRSQNSHKVHCRCLPSPFCTTSNVLSGHHKAGMRKRSIKSFWTQALKRQMVTLTRTALRAGRTAQKVVAKTPPRTPKRTAQKDSAWRTGTAASAAGIRRYHLFEPAGKAPPQGIALVVMLHGCNQDARGFAASTRMNQLARSAGFMVLYPEQDRFANLQACWNWFDTRSGRAQKEAASILSVLDQVCAKYPIDAGRIVLAGMSAGASMAALVALQDPARFSAVAMHSGVGPGMADSAASALAAMRGRSPKGALRSGHLPSTWPPLLVIQGTRDTVVAPSNGALTVRRWAEAVRRSGAQVD